jgi:predicted nicotinamide N-methyase
VLELGCGISPLNALALASLRHRPVSHYVLTDQPYVHRLVDRNLAENWSPSVSRSRPGGNGRNHHVDDGPSPIRFEALDWETDDITPCLTGVAARSFDLVLACDCIYNEALVDPLVQTCVDACRLRTLEDQRPTACVVAQQLRNDDVFTQWLARFHRDFHVWRFPDHLLPEKLRPGAGFVVHLGLLRA